MSKRDWNLSVKDINTSAKRIMAYTKGMTKSGFLRDRKTYDAVMRNLQIIGEAANNLPAHVKRKYPTIAWKRITGLRNVVTHEYFGLDNVIIWDIIKNKIPALQAEVKAILKDLPK